MKGLTLVIYAHDFVVDLQVKALGTDGQRSQNLDPSLSIDRSLSVERRHSWDIGAHSPSDEVKDILICLLECKINREGWKCCKLGV